MKIDLSIKIVSDTISVKSIIANYSETKPSIIAFSKKIGETFELCEAVGENWTAQTMESAGHYAKGTRTFRVVNPFVPQYFESYAASLMIDFFCTKTFFEIKPARGHWRKMFGFDSFNLILLIESYFSVSADKRNEFEKLLAKKMRKLHIEQ